jgi:hypothetical protein
MGRMATHARAAHIVDLARYHGHDPEVTDPGDYTSAIEIYVRDKYGDCLQVFVTPSRGRRTRVSAQAWCPGAPSRKISLLDMRIWLETHAPRKEANG